MSDVKELTLTFAESYNLFKDLCSVAENLKQHIDTSLEGCESVKYDLVDALDILYEQVADMAKVEDGSIVNVYQMYYEIAETCMKIIVYNLLREELCDDEEEDTE